MTVVKHGLFLALRYSADFLFRMIQINKIFHCKITDSTDTFSFVFVTDRG